MILHIEVQRTNDPKGRKPAIRLILDADEESPNIEDLKVLLYTASNCLPSGVSMISTVRLKTKGKGG